jgi:cation:H+ antiporter
VDAVFAFQAGADPAVAQLGYAVANMTGANRLLIGLGWSLVVLVACWRQRAHKMALAGHQVLEMSVLLAATIYAFLVPFKGELNLLDLVVLLALFGIYMWATARGPAEEPELAGPAAMLGQLSTGRRRAVTAGLFLIAAYTIFVSAEPFAAGLVETGHALGIDEFLLVQWLAPLASEAPEFIVAMLFVWRGQAAAGLRTLVSSEVNQWTLLVATLPLVFSVGAGALTGMPLVLRQQHEVWLTAAQSLFAIVLISRFVLSRWEAVALLLPFLVQLVLPPVIEGWDVRMMFTAAYVLAALGLLLDPRRRRALGRWPGELAAVIAQPAPAEPLRAPDLRPGAAPRQPTAR